MKRLGLWVNAGLVSLVLCGCGHQGADGSSATSASSAISAGPAKPAANADVNTWGNYLAEQGKLHSKDVSQHPYIYVIPDGDSTAATSRRKDEVDSISHSIGPILMPGGMLVLGGADAQETSTFVADLSKTIKADALKGIVVLVVADNSQTQSITVALKPTGATVRVVAM